MKVEWNEEDGVLRVEDEEFHNDGPDGAVEVPRTTLRQLRTRDIPVGVSVIPMRRVLGAQRDFYPDPGGVVLERQRDVVVLHVDDALSADEEEIPSVEERGTYLRLAAERLAALLADDQRVGKVAAWKVGDVVDNELVYYSYSRAVSVGDETVTDLVDESAGQIAERFERDDEAASLAAFLRTTARQPAADERTMIHRILPRLALLAGFEPGSVQLGPRTSTDHRVLQLDAMLVDQRRGVRVGVEFYRAATVPKDRLSDWMERFDLSAIVGLAGETLTLMTPRTEASIYALATITVEQAAEICASLSRPRRDTHGSRAPEQQGTPDPTLLGLIERVEHADTSDEKGRTLEDVASVLLGSLPGVSVKHRNLLSETAELDVVCEHDGETIPRCLTFSTRYFICECKNWSRPADVKVLAAVLDNLRVFRLNFAVLFSRLGVTGRSHSHAALGKIRSAFQGQGHVVVVLTLEDLKAVASGSEQFPTLLDRKIDDVVLQRA